MKIAVKLGALIFLIPFILIGCHQQDSSLTLKEEIKEIHIFESTDFKKESSNLIVSSNKTKNTKIFEIIRNMINDGTEQDGVVDTVEPNYYVEIIYKDKSITKLYLWLIDAEGGKGSFMEEEDTQTIYNFSEELNNQLIDLLDSVEN